MLRRWSHIAVIAFCLWHMFAVAAYLLPSSGEGTLGDIAAQTRRIAAPYVLSLSQWQKWNIFSPDPLRKDSIYRLEKKVRGEWVIADDLTRATLPWATRAKELKVLGRLEDDWATLIPAYLKAQCERYDVHSRNLRLIAATRLLPRDLGTLKSLRSYPPERTRRVLGTVHCF